MKNKVAWLYFLVKETNNINTRCFGLDVAVEYNLNILAKEIVI